MFLLGQALHKLTLFNWSLIFFFFSKVGEGEGLIIMHKGLPHQVLKVSSVPEHPMAGGVGRKSHKKGRA